MPYYDKNAILKALTKEQVIKIVTDLGSKGYRTDSSGNLIFQTICHGGDSYKLYTIMNLQISILEEHFNATPHVANHFLFLN